MPVKKLYPLKLNGNRRRSTPGNEYVNLGTICGNLRKPTPDTKDDNEMIMIMT